MELESILISVLIVMLIGVALIVIVLLLANMGAYFTSIEQGTTVFINTGERLRSIWPNVGGYRLSNVEDLEGRRWLIRATNKEEELDAFFHGVSFRKLQEWLWERFGVRFISILWPHVNVHAFNIRSMKRLSEIGDLKKESPAMKDRVVDSPNKDTLVPNLRFLVPRPIYAEGIELAGDNSKINLLLLPVFRQVVPAVPVYYLKGDFFTQLDAAIETVITGFAGSHRVAVYKRVGKEKEGLFVGDFYPQNKAEGEDFRNWYGVDPNECEPSYLTYAHWLKLAKTGERSIIERYLRRLNVSTEYLNRLRDAGKSELVKYVENELIHHDSSTIPDAVIGQIPTGIVPRFGFALVSFRVVDWEAGAGSAELAKALLEKETQAYRAEGVRQTAMGARDAKSLLAEGEGLRYGMLIKALTDKGVDPNVAAQVVREQVRTENVRDSKVTTYIEGGGSNASIMIPAIGSGSKEKETV